MAQGTRTITADELFWMPDDGFHRYELVAGQLRTMTPAGSLHGVVGMRLAVALGAYVDQHELGVLFAADTGFKLASNPDTVRAPDVAFVRRERIPATGIPRTFWPGAPDLAVEVLSPTDERSEVNEKIADYLAAGVAYVWFVEPSSRRVTIHQRNAPPRVLGEADTLDGGDLLPGFRYPLSKLFRASS
ncbi:MAG TPA: Uma2 family endonuclease [Vicinamibacterales bacterium]|nr:Uma2 family endonuclease [Vicinamibacterales bacterium]